MRPTEYLRIEDGSAVGEARRMAVALALELGFDEHLSGRAALVATEMATNILKHAGYGEFLLTMVENGDEAGLEFLSLDKGPGIPDLAMSLTDGYSTAGSSGTGLGAIRRLSSCFDIYSTPGKGTAILSRIWKRLSRASLKPFKTGALLLPMPGENSCGDAWAYRMLRDRIFFMVADGLGHGPEAAHAADLAVGVFHRSCPCKLRDLVDRIHSALRGTRGAALAVAEIIPHASLVRYAGVGNISGRIFSPTATQRMVSMNGTVGYVLPDIREFSYPWPEGGVLIMHSDGLKTHWNIDDFPGLVGKHPSIIAGMLFCHYNRGRDDLAVAVAR